MQATTRSPDEARAEAIGQLCGFLFVLVVLGLVVVMTLRRLLRGKQPPQEG